MPGHETPGPDPSVEGSAEPAPANKDGSNKQPNAAAMEEVVAKAVDAALRKGVLLGRPGDVVGENSKPLGSSNGAFAHPDQRAQNPAVVPQMRNESTGNRS